jgi:hypothetical protein
LALGREQRLNPIRHLIEGSAELADAIAADRMNS